MAKDSPAPGSPPSPDPSLVRRAQAGDRSAFAQLVTELAPLVHAIAWRMTRDAHAAADVTQDVFLQLWRKLDRFDSARPFRPWFSRVATNAAINAVKRRRRRETSLDAPGMRAAYEPSDPGPAPPELASLSERQSVLLDEVARLSPSYSVVVSLHYMQGMSVADIAEHLGIPVGTVKIRLFRGRAMLREKLHRLDQKNS